MPYVGKDYSDMAPTERRLRGFNFDQSFGDGEMLDSASFILSVDDDSDVDDATPSDRLDGDAQVEGTIGRIRIKEPLAGVSYILEGRGISSRGRKVTLYSRFTVRWRGAALPPCGGRQAADAR